jgi:ferredoxin-NADP reductase
MGNPQKVKCHVKKIINHGDRVYSLELIPESIIPKFRPGQFLQLGIDPYDPSSFWPESRAFSITSSPEERDRLSITYSVRGKFTARMENEITDGSSIWIKLPYGHFFVSNEVPVVLLAGGTGITAFIAFLNGTLKSLHQPISIIYGAREAHLMIYRELVTNCRNLRDGIQTYLFLENNPNSEDDIIQGKISVDKVWPNLRIFPKSIFYLSGPPAMIETITDQLIVHEINPNAIQIDGWE